MESDRAGVSVLSRIVRILEAFDVETRTLGISELARKSELPIPTAHRLVGQMLDIGLLERTGKRVRVGVRMWELASRSQRVLSLREVARPYLEDVQAIVQHHTQLGVLEGSDVLFVDLLSSKNAVINITTVASRLPAHACSSGLVLLANSSTKFQESILKSELNQLTSQTIVDPTVLRRTLSEVRRQGFAIARSAVDLSAAGVAVPLRDKNNHVVATISTIVPNDQQHTSVALPLLLAAGRGISRALQSTPRDRASLS